MATALVGSWISNLEELTDPAVEPVSLEAAWTTARVDDDIQAIPTEQAFMQGAITTARLYCENWLSRAFVRRTFEFRLNRFPFAIPTVYYPYYSLERMPTQLYGMIPIPSPPLFKVDYIRYLNPDGSPGVLDPTQYEVELGGKFQGVITPVYGQTFPATRYAMSAVRIGFTAGYSDDDSRVPAGVKQAILMLAAHYYRNREATAPGAALPQDIAFGVKALLAPYEWGFYA